MIGSVDIKTRPLRLAHLVDPNNVAQIREAVRLSSSLWGGMYAPIIPLYKRMPKGWGENDARRPRPEAVIRGYLETFDPDVLIQLSAEVPPFVTATGVKIVRPQEIWSPLATGRTLSPQFGIGVFELLGKIFDEHFRYKEKYPTRVILPQVSGRLSAFWACVFGEISPALMPILDARFREPLGITDVQFTVDRFADLVSADVLSPRRITEYGLMNLSRSGLRGGARVFFLDATKADDIIDFWNLRALGGSVFALRRL